MGAIAANWAHSQHHGGSDAGFISSRDFASPSTGPLCRSRASDSVGAAAFRSRQGTAGCAFCRARAGRRAGGPSRHSLRRGSAFCVGAMGRPACRGTARGCLERALCVDGDTAGFDCAPVFRRLHGARSGGDAILRHHAGLHRGVCGPGLLRQPLPPVSVLGGDRPLLVQPGGILVPPAGSSQRCAQSAADDAPGGVRAAGCRSHPLSRMQVRRSGPMPRFPITSPRLSFC